MRRGTAQSRGAGPHLMDRDVGCLQEHEMKRATARL
jgi:hypothetical protein